MNNIVNVYVPDDAMRDLYKISSILGLDASDVLLACFRSFCSKIDFSNLID